MPRAYEAEIRLRRADGIYRWCHFRNVPWHDTHGRLTRWYCLVTDIDEQKRAEEDLRRTQARLERASHLAAVSELSAAIAHEINQPLAAVIAGGHACQRWLSAEPPGIERALLSAERVVRDANAAGEVIRRIRSLFRRAPSQKESLDVNAVIHEVCSLMTDDLRARGVVLRTDLKADMPRVAADRVQVQQLLSNLARNAMEAMDTVTGRAKALTICSHHESGSIVVQVVDCGIGISDAQAPFECLSSTKAQGMGIGLAICRSIVEAHGGKLWAARNALHGATFGFFLPLDEPLSTRSE